MEIEVVNPTVPDVTDAPSGSSYNNVPMVTNEQDLDKVLGEGDKPDPQKPPVEPAKDPATKSAKSDKAQPRSVLEMDGDKPDADKDIDNPDDEEEFDSLPHYLDKQLGLKLNLEAIPQDMTREQEAELVTTIIKQITDGANKAISQYRDLAALLEDEEVRMVMEAKMSGKGLKDVVSVFSQKPANMTDEQVVEHDLRRRYPKATADWINKTMDGIRKGGGLEEAAQVIREQAVEDEKLAARRQAELDRQQQLQEQQQELQAVQRFSTFVGGIKALQGIPITDEMKQEIVRFNVQPIDAEGNTHLDIALQSDEGRVLASLGVLYMDQLVRHAANKIANQKNRTFIEKVLDKPDSLQSSSHAQEPIKFDPAIANLF